MLGSSITFIVNCCVSFLLLLRTIEMLFHCYLTIISSSGDISPVAKAWQITNVVRKFGLNVIYRLPVLVPVSSILISNSTLPEWASITFAAIIFFSLWVQLAQTLLSRLTFGASDKFLRHWFTEIEWKDRNTKLPDVPKNVAIRDMSLFLAGFVILAILGYAGIYSVLHSVDPASLKGEINGFWDCLYFSSVTFATVGYGDILPVTSFARIIVVSEIFVSFGALVMLVLTYSITSTDEKNT